MAYQDVTRRADAVTAGIKYAEREIATAKAAVARGHESAYSDHIVKLQTRLNATVESFKVLELRDSVETKIELDRFEHRTSSIAQMARAAWRQIDKIEARRIEGESE